TKQQGGFDLVAFAAIVVTILSWASSFVVIRICLGPLTPIELATARYVAAGAIARVYLVIYRPMPEKRDFFRLSVAAVLFIAAYAVLLNTGEQTVAAGQASFII
ncbi:EamA family transporter, partial [Rhizobium leguminosarum]|uniref:EamA family transporter n=1 Tax=Rhizobium leguminosarum TaxID=384 RepID=UPI003F9C7635